MDFASIVSGSVVLYWLEKIYSTQVWSGKLAAADFTALVVFCLFPKKTSLLAFPKIRRPKAQIRYLATPVFAGFFIYFCLCLVLSTGTASAFYYALLWGGASISALFVERSCLTFCLYQPTVVTKLRRRIAIVGSGETASELITRLSEDVGQTYSLFGAFRDEDKPAGTGSNVGTLDDLIHRSRKEPLHAIILAFQSDETDNDARVRRLAVTLKPVLSDIYVTPNLVSGFDRVLPCESLGDKPLFVIQRRPLSEIQVIEKTLVDFLLACFAIVFLFPILACVAIAIKVDSRGPIFFQQPRIGKNGKEFLVYKFRSMHAHMSDLMAAQQTSRDDPRVTRIGKWLRKLSIDEIPQLLNVLKGEMSLVGPRPHAPHTRAGGMLLDDALAEYVLRYHVKPGITGWAQINGARGELVTLEDLEKRVAYDLDYIGRWSLFFDFKIMFLTVIREVFSRHAF
nr:exopolysaccharide biosynthesis polyprenyl glycosylphosphotransferase [Acetobacter conturbans]